MLQDDPNDPFLGYGLAMEYLGEGNLEEALARFQNVFERSPEYVPAYQQAGQLLSRLDRTDEAREVFRRGIVAAQKKGDLHAAQEMQGMLMELD
jgi:Tfp pilus assembly protein PilF